MSVSEEPWGPRGPCRPPVGADLVWGTRPPVPLCVVPLELGLRGVGRGDGCWGCRLAGSWGSSSLCGPRLSGGALLCLPGDRPIPVECVLRLEVPPAVQLGTCAQARAPAGSLLPPALRLLLSPGSEGGSREGPWRAPLGEDAAGACASRSPPQSWPSALGGSWPRCFWTATWLFLRRRLRGPHLTLRSPGCWGGAAR